MKYFFISEPISEEESRLFSCFFNPKYPNGIRSVDGLSKESKLSKGRVLKILMNPRHEFYLKIGIGKSFGKFSLRHRYFTLLNPSFTSHCKN